MRYFSIVLTFDFDMPRRESYFFLSNGRDIKLLLHMQWAIWTFVLEKMWAILNFNLLNQLKSKSVIDFHQNFVFSACAARLLVSRLFKARTITYLIMIANTIPTHAAIA